MAAIHRGQKVGRVSSPREEGRLEVSQKWVDSEFPGKQDLGKKCQIYLWSMVDIKAHLVHRIKEIPLSWWQLMIEL